MIELKDDGARLRAARGDCQMNDEKREHSETLSGRPPVPGHEYGPAPAPIDSATGMHADYWVLSAEERAKGFVRPLRRTYRHMTCGTTTTMAQALAETCARDPAYYTATMCVYCRGHFPVGPDGEFRWSETDEKVGT